MSIIPDLPPLPDLPEIPSIPGVPVIESPCPVLSVLNDAVTSAANRAVDAITGSIPADPTSGTAAGIAAKISSAVNTVKAEAEELMSKVKGAAGEIEETFMEFVTTTQNKIAEIEKAIETATEEMKELLLQEIEDLKGAIQEVIPAWMNKTPDELLQDAIDGLCDPEMYGLGKPSEGTAKAVIPSEAPVENPGPSEVEVFSAPSRPPININPIVEVK